MILWWVCIVNELEVAGDLERIEQHVHIEQEPKRHMKTSSRYWCCSARAIEWGVPAKYRPFRAVRRWRTTRRPACRLFTLQYEIDEGRITLGSQITSGGSNLSVGQRQILALVRVIVRQSKLLILDEGA
ncbi:hypothetical protein DAEQUDRAFT_381920 [Daedalea quercina L-15889]|uniref:ABC transporter domain-containing protein n=1 Tax=Daedalea quercina L-15889 TaxID=1314783 RepID=A0A165NZY6_9APHY|nr:hypothetical protein DAEQUDRAFT_381920 [Daedalea quercina L-15889]